MKKTPLFQLWLIDSTEKICICYSSHLAYWNNVIMEQFLQENALLRHLLCFYAWRSYAQITATDIGEIFWYNWFYAPTSYQLYFKSFLDICWGVIRTPLAQNSKKHLIKEYLDCTRPGQWGKRTFFRHRLYVWTS